MYAQNHTIGPREIVTAAQHLLRAAVCRGLALRLEPPPTTVLTGLLTPGMTDSTTEMDPTRRPAP